MASGVWSDKFVTTAVHLVNLRFLKYTYINNQKSFLQWSTSACQCRGTNTGSSAGAGSYWKLSEDSDSQRVPLMQKCTVLGVEAAHTYTEREATGTHKNRRRQFQGLDAMKLQKGRGSRKCTVAPWRKDKLKIYREACTVSECANRNIDYS